MNLLFVSNVFPPGFIGGYEMGACELAQGLRAAGHEISVLTSDYFEDYDGELRDLRVERGLECHVISHAINLSNDDSTTVKGFYVNYANIRKLSSAVRRFKPDVVLLFNLMGVGPLGVIEFLRAAGIPTIIYLMDNVFSLVDRRSAYYEKYAAVFGQPCFGNRMKVIAMSRNLMTEISETLGFVPSDIVYVPGWTQEAAIVSEPSQAANDGKTRFVACSRIAAHKGVEIIADAVAELVQRGETQFSIDVYGAGQVGPFLQRVQSKGLAGQIRYLGNKPKAEMLRLFREYDALVFPTWEREPFGFTVPEAAGAGCFPIMTAEIGASEWFVDNMDCMKISRTANELATAMHRVIHMPAGARNQMRREASLTAKRYLTFGRWLKVVEAACHEMLDRKCSNARNKAGRIDSAFLALTQLWQEALLK